MGKVTIFSSIEAGRVGNPLLWALGVLSVIALWLEVLKFHRIWRHAVKNRYSLSSFYANKSKNRTEKDKFTIWYFSVWGIILFSYLVISVPKSVAKSVVASKTDYHTISQDTKEGELKIIIANTSDGLLIKDFNQNNKNFSEGYYIEEITKGKILPVKIKLSEKAKEEVMK